VVWIVFVNHPVTLRVPPLLAEEGERRRHFPPLGKEGREKEILPSSLRRGAHIVGGVVCLD
jgi:hypothetical protein